MLPRRPGDTGRQGLRHLRRPADGRAAPDPHARLALDLADGVPLHPAPAAAHRVQLPPAADRRQPAARELQLRADQHPRAALRRALGDGRHRVDRQGHGAAAERTRRTGATELRRQAHPCRGRPGHRCGRADRTRPGTHRRRHRGQQRRHRLDLPAPGRAAAPPHLDRRQDRTSALLDGPVRLVLSAPTSASTTCRTTRWCWARATRACWKTCSSTTS